MLESYHYQDAEKVLKEVFGYDSFRLLQKDIITSVLNHNDTLAIMPTGGGKSLCYQIPALMLEGITLVISPLISLMQDQVDALKNSGVSAVFLNSSLESSDYENTITQILEGKIKIVYLSPEGLSGERIKNLLKSENINVSLISIDEAHCVSEWGHDFRPDYLKIASIKKYFPRATYLALTASATKKVQDDITKNLCLKNPNIFISSFNRKNIFLNVAPKQNALQQILECIKRHKNESGIIYCFSRKQVDTLTQKLKSLGFSVLNYHAGLSDIERKENQSKFIRDEVQIMIATLAFGMGINKPNVRFVIHNDIPKSIEQYYQEIGRAGRDGLASEALLLYSASDIVKIRYFFDESADRKRAEKLLQGIVYFASSKSCRRKTLLTYFGEDFKSLGESKKVSYKNIPTNKNITGIEDNFPCCDICQNSDIPLSDVTLPFQKLLSCIIRTGQKFGSSYVIDVLLGSKQKRILENEHDKLSTYGIGKNIPKEMWFQITESLVYENYILKTDDYSVLKITAKGMNALRNRNTIFLPLREIEYYVAEKHSRSKYERNKNRESFLKNTLFAEDKNKNSENEDIILNFKKWRIDEAKNQNVPPYIIFGDKTLHELVHYLPKSKSELKMIYGLGDAKVERYGDAILRIIKNY